MSGLAPLDSPAPGLQVFRSPTIDEGRLIRFRLRARALSICVAGQTSGESFRGSTHYLMAVSDGGLCLGVRSDQTCQSGSDIVGQYLHMKLAVK